MTPVVMVGIECTCLAYLVVVLVANLVLPHSKGLKRDGFLLCLISIIVGVIFDMGSWACECGPAPRWLQYTCNTLCLMVPGLIVSFFAYYFVGRIRETSLVSWRYAQVIAIVNVCGTASIVVAAVCGILYEAVPYPGQPGVVVFMAGSFLYFAPNCISSLSLIVLFTLVLKNAKAIDKNKVIVFSIYFLLPLIAGALEMVWEQLQLSYAVSAVCISIVYVMLQRNHLDELMVREQLLNEWSYVDALTNLLNRRAFDRDMQEAAGKSVVNIAFCDLNGLKKINDEKGHQAGDRYLMSFSELLVRHFSHDCVYRISGDEFVVVDCKKNEEDFGSSVKNLRQEMGSSFAMAALGTVTGPGNDFSDLLKKAEIKMYDDKEEFYRKNPSYSRRRADRAADGSR